MSVAAACRAWAAAAGAGAVGAGAAEAVAPLFTLPPDAAVQVRSAGPRALLLCLPARRPAFSLGARADVVLDACWARPAEVAAAVDVFVALAARVASGDAQTARDLVLLLEAHNHGPIELGAADVELLPTAAIVLAAGGEAVASSRGLPLLLVDHGQRLSMQLTLAVRGAGAATTLARLLPLLLGTEAGADPDAAVAATLADAAAIHEVAAGIWIAALRLPASRDAAAQALGLDGPLRCRWQRTAAQISALGAEPGHAHATLQLAWSQADDLPLDGAHRPRGWAALVRAIEELAARQGDTATLLVSSTGGDARSPRQGPLQAALLQGLQTPIVGLEPAVPLLVLAPFALDSVGWHQTAALCLGCLGLPPQRLQAAAWALLTEG